MTTLDMIVDGGIASAVATIFSNPFDTVRSRMQLQGELRKTGEYTIVYHNLGQAILRIMREEGILALQKGFGAAVLWQVAQNGVRLGIYPPVKATIESIFMQSQTENMGTTTSSRSSRFPIMVLSGAICGVVGAFIASPFAMVKTRLQTQRNAMPPSSGMPLSIATTGEQFHYTGIWEGLRKIYQKGGLRGLWSGATVACQRTMMGSATQLATYDTIKEYVCRHYGWDAGDYRAHTIAATAAAATVTVVMNPLDTVATRIYNHRLEDAGKYSRNVAFALLQIYRIEGAHGLYKGSFALFARLTPHTIATFLTLEYLRKLRERFGSRSYSSGSIVSAPPIWSGRNEKKSS